MMTDTQPRLNPLVPNRLDRDDAFPQVRCIAESEIGITMYVMLKHTTSDTNGNTVQCTDELHTLHIDNEIGWVSRCCLHSEHKRVAHSCEQDNDPSPAQQIHWHHDLLG